MATREHHPTQLRRSVYRNPANRWLVLAIMAIGVAVLGGSALAGPSPEGPSDADYLAFSAALAAVFIGLVYWRCYRGGLYPREERALVVNFFYTHRVPWTEIKSFSVGPTLNEYRVVILERSDGRSIPITATAGWAPFLPDRFVTAPDPIAKELNALLDERRDHEDQDRDASGGVPRG